MNVRLRPERATTPVEEVGWKIVPGSQYFWCKRPKKECEPLEVSIPKTAAKSAAKVHLSLPVDCGRQVFGRGLVIVDELGCNAERLEEDWKKARAMLNKKGIKGW